jgi:nucleotide-binding universal stress UspA family protein
MTIRRILVPVDYSEGSQAALAYAATLAQELGASLDVVHVWDRPAYVSDSVLVGPSGEKRPLTELIRENAEAEMKTFIARAHLPAEAALETRLLSGNPAGRVLEELALGNHELLVVGTHGRTGLRHLLLGSVAEKLVRLAPVPVLTVPSPRT